MLPALANKVTPDNVHIPKALSNLFSINWLYGFVASSILYYILNLIFPDHRTLIPSVIQGDVGFDNFTEGIQSSEQQSIDGNSSNAEKGMKMDEPVEVGSNIRDRV
jgi:hypothetical protein